MIPHGRALRRASTGRNLLLVALFVAGYLANLGHFASVLHVAGRTHTGAIHAATAEGASACCHRHPDHDDAARHAPRAGARAPGLAAADAAPHSAGRSGAACSLLPLTRAGESLAFAVPSPLAPRIETSATATGSATPRTRLLRYRLAPKHSPPLPVAS